MRVSGLLGVALSVGLSAGLAQGGSVYADSTGDLFNNGFGHLDIVSVGLSNDSTYLYVDILLGGDLDATAWGKYALGIDTGNGPSSNSNGWGRNIDWGRGITHWVATWADDGGSGVNGQVWSYNGAAWQNDAGVVGDDSQHAAGRQRFAVALADLGLSVGDTFSFDVISTGGTTNDPGVDHLSRSGQATPFWDTRSLSGEFLTYTIVPLPPAAWGGLAMLGLVAAARRLRG